MPLYLSVKGAFFVQREQIDMFGGSYGVKDAGIIECALQRPQTGYYVDVLEEVAALWESLTMNYGFIDGNERVGFACMFSFLRMNELRLCLTNAEAQDFFMTSFGHGEFKKDRLEAWLRSKVEKD